MLDVADFKHYLEQKLIFITKYYAKYIAMQCSKLLIVIYIIMRDYMQGLEI